MRLSSFNPKEFHYSITHMHGLPVYLKEELPFSWDSRKLLPILTYVFDWLYLHVFLLFSLLITLSLYKAFDVVSSNIDKVLSINLFANMFEFKGFKFHHNIVSVSINFPSNSKQDVSFYRMAYDYSCTNWDCLHDHLSYVSWDNIFKLNAYQVKPHSSLWFSAA